MRKILLRILTATVLLPSQTFAQKIPSEFGLAGAGAATVPAGGNSSGSDWVLTAILVFGAISVLISIAIGIFFVIMNWKERRWERRLARLGIPAKKDHRQRAPRF